MKIWHDWKVLEDCRTIEPISVGMVAADDRELYLVNRDAPWDRIAQHSSLMENVVPHLPVADIGGRTFAGIIAGAYHLPHPGHPDASALVSREVLRAAVRAYLEETAYRDPDGVELWGYIPAYDHVCLTQLFGPMIARPPAMPRRTSCIEQLAVDRGIAPAEIEGRALGAAAHHALADARWTREVHEWIEAGGPNAPRGWRARRTGASW